MEASNTYSVYIHTNKTNNKKYVGLTKQCVYERWGKNGKGYSTTPLFYNAIKKYGWENFSHEIVAHSLSKEDACEMEIKLIKELKTQDKNFGYNISNGGTAPTQTESIRAMISEKLKGNKNGLGKVCSEEKKKKISEAQKGRKLTEEHKAKLSAAKKGSTHKPISKESRLKIAEKHKKNKVYCKELDKVFISIQECARQTGSFATNVCKCCKGKIKSTNGYHFSYYEE